MSANLSPRDFQEIFREQEENENELARIELEQARLKLQLEQNKPVKTRDANARRRVELAEKELRAKEERQERRRQELERQVEFDRFASIFAIILEVGSLVAFYYALNLKRRGFLPPFFALVENHYSFLRRLLNF